MFDKPKDLVGLLGVVSKKPYYVFCGFNQISKSLRVLRRFWQFFERRISSFH